MYSVKSPASKSSPSSPLAALAWLALALLVLVCNQNHQLQVECQEQVLTVESRQQKDNDELTDTIKYLENIDKYFSQIARPRFGRSNFKQPRYELAELEDSPRPAPLGAATMRLLRERLAHSYDKSLAL